MPFNILGHLEAFITIKIGFLVNFFQISRRFFFKFRCTFAAQLVGLKTLPSFSASQLTQGPKSNRNRKKIDDQNIIAWSFQNLRF